MKVTKTSILSGVTRTLEINISEKQLQDWQSGMLIQTAMPNLTDTEREFIMTGITDEEWTQIFPERED